MKLWKENKISQEWDMSNRGIADKFLKVWPEMKSQGWNNIAKALVHFISSKEGLNSIWDWDQKKGSIDGSKDMIEILSIIEEEGK